jgi:hypothetical protein
MKHGDRNFDGLLSQRAGDSLREQACREVDDAAGRGRDDADG